MSEKTAVKEEFVPIVFCGHIITDAELAARVQSFEPAIKAGALTEQQVLELIQSTNTKHLVPLSLDNPAGREYVQNTLRGKWAKSKGASLWRSAYERSIKASDFARKAYGMVGPIEIKQDTGLDMVMAFGESHTLPALDTVGIMVEVKKIEHLQVKGDSGPINGLDVTYGVRAPITDDDVVEDWLTVQSLFDQAKNHWLDFMKANGYPSADVNKVKLFANSFEFTGGPSKPKKSSGGGSRTAYEYSRDGDQYVVAYEGNEIARATDLSGLLEQLKSSLPGIGKSFYTSQWTRSLESQFGLK